MVILGLEVVDGDVTWNASASRWWKGCDRQFMQFQRELARFRLQHGGVPDQAGGRFLALAMDVSSTSERIAKR